MLAKPSRHLFLGISALAIVFLVLGFYFYLNNQALVSSKDKTNQLSNNLVLPSLTPEEVKINYRVGFQKIAERLGILLDRKLGSADEAEIVGIKDDLVKLAVPPGLQPYHLGLVLKVSLLAELLKPGRVVLASRNAPTLIDTQAELKKLLQTAPKV